jgi:hypothetical protein
MFTTVLFKTFSPRHDTLSFPPYYSEEITSSIEKRKKEWERD